MTIPPEMTVEQLRALEGRETKASDILDRMCMQLQCTNDQLISMVLRGEVIMPDEFWKQLGVRGPNG